MRGEIPLIVAHRGASATSPENTLAAFRRAIECGSDGIEFDVQLAADGVAVVIHDDTLERTAGRSGSVTELTSEELATLDVGSWFNRENQDSADPEFAEQTVPTLRETLDLLSGFAGRIFVELKSNGPDILPLCEAVSEIINDSPLKPQLVVESFRLAAIPAIRLLCPEVATAALFEPGIESILKEPRHIVTIARELGADELSLHHSLATHDLVTAAHNADFPILVWTVDEPDWIGRAIDSGIYAIVVNDPRRMMEARRDLSEEQQARIPG